MLSPLGTSTKTGLTRMSSLSPYTPAPTSAFTSLSGVAQTKDALETSTAEFGRVSCVLPITCSHQNTCLCALLRLTNNRRGESVQQLQADVSPCINKRWLPLTSTTPVHSSAKDRTNSQYQEGDKDTSGNDPADAATLLTASSSRLDAQISGVATRLPQ